MKKTVLLFVLLGLLGLTGCSMFVKAPTVKVKSLTVTSLDPGGLGMELLLAVTNPNFYDLKLKGYSYDLKVMALPLAKGGAREEVKFPSDVETELRIPIRVAYGDLVEILKKAPDADRIPYQLSAGLDVDTLIGQTTIPVNQTGTYAIPKSFRPSNLLNRLGDLFR
ncbi:LEA type 2 family protein [Geomonas sp. Red32]|uniref:LEA type 2 family protein n=1 Tax=Geomonas sp. Red32 TaxID=2912856 RepID=UPI00202D0377|nr:LEA type 2 family protein [Geomonas sp. Red32]